MPLTGKLTKGNRPVLYLCSLCKKNTNESVLDFEMAAIVPPSDDPESDQWEYWMKQRAAGATGKLGNYAGFSGDEYWIDVICLDSIWKPFWRDVVNSNSFIYISRLVENTLVYQPDTLYREVLAKMIESNDLDECHATAHGILGNLEKEAEIRQWQERKRDRVKHDPFRL